MSKKTFKLKLGHDIYNRDTEYHNPLGEVCMFSLQRMFKRLKSNKLPGQLKIRLSTKWLIGSVEMVYHGYEGLRFVNTRGNPVVFITIPQDAVLSTFYRVHKLRECADSVFIQISQELSAKGKKLASVRYFR